MAVEHPRAAREWTGLGDFVEDVLGSVGVVADVVLGHTGALVAQALRGVDRLVDDVVTDAAAIAREAEAFFDATLDRWIAAERGDATEREI